MLIEMGQDVYSALWGLMDHSKCMQYWGLRCTYAFQCTVHATACCYPRSLCKNAFVS